MSEPTTAITFGAGVFSGLLLCVFCCRIPPTLRWWQSLSSS